MAFAIPTKFITAAALCAAFNAAAFAASPEDKLGPIKGESTAAAVDKIGPIKGESQRAADKIGDIEGEARENIAGDRIGQELLNVPMGDMIREMSTAPAAPTGCKMLDGSADENCDGVADNKAVSATDYNSSRSNKSEDSGLASPDPDLDLEKGEFYRIEGHMGVKAPAATDYNSSRSNKTDGIAAPDPDTNTDLGSGDDGDAKAAD